MSDPAYELVWFIDDQGEKPCLRWIKEDLSDVKRPAIGYAMYEILEHQGKDVCKNNMGRDLGGGIFEFKLDDEKDGEDILLRVFCHLYGNKKILVLHGYDKGKNPKERYQNQQIEIARDRLGVWKRRKREAAKQAKQAQQNDGTKAGPGKPKKQSRGKR